MARPPNPDAAARLLEAARAIFADVGVDAARIQDVAARAGFSKAAFYLYFASKEQVFAKLVTELFQRMEDVSTKRHQAFTELVARLGPVSAEDWADGSPRLAEYARLDQEYTLAALQVMWDERDMLGCILDQTTGPRRALVDQFIQVTQSTLSTRLAEAMNAGFVRSDVDGDLASEMIVGIYLQIGRRMTRIDEAPDLERWARMVDQFIAEGLGCRSMLNASGTETEGAKS